MRLIVAAKNFLNLFSHNLVVDQIWT